jgi:mRNA interferase RelE/StbE
MYKFLIAKRALKDLDNLDSNTKIRIVSKLKEYSVDPFANCSKLSDSKIGTYRFRIGDYRVIFDIDDVNIVVLRIAHRREIYK